MIADTRKKITTFFLRRVWEIDTGSLGGFKTFLVKTIRLIYVAVGEFTEGNLTLRAMSLVYTTLLSIVPLLAISFSVLKAFGVHTEIVEPFLLQFLAPMGSKGQEITSQIISFVENVNVRVLGSIGMIVLIYTVVSVIQKIEKSFNAIWRINKPRSLIRRFSDYISLILIGPVLIFSAIGVTASFRSNALVQKVISIEPFGSFYVFAIDLLPYILVCSAFTFLFIFIPNTKVQFKSALAGGVLAGVLWETAGWAFATFTVSSAKYDAIYSGFAILIMFMIWLYVSWLILLVGAQVSYYHQYPHFLSAKKEAFQTSNRLRERIAFLTMYYIAYNFYHDKTPWTMHALIDKLSLPLDPMNDVFSLLEKNGLLRETGDDPPAYLPARALETITLAQLLSAVRVASTATASIESQLEGVPEVDGIINSIDKASFDSLGNKSLKDIVHPSEKIS